MALEQGSIASQPNTVSVGAPGAERRIVNVAPGIAGTDAVNLNQLNAVGNDVNSVDNLVNSVDRRAASGTATAIAMSGISIPDNKRFAVGANYGVFRGESALAAGAAMRLTDYAQIDASVGVGFDHGDLGGRVGATFTW